MRTRRYPSSIRTPGRAYRVMRRHVAREAAAGREVKANTRQESTNMSNLMRGMYTHIRLIPGTPVGQTMNQRKPWTCRWVGNECVL